MCSKGLFKRETVFEYKTFSLVNLQALMQEKDKNTGR